MSHQKIVRAWKDEAYRLNLSEAERSMLPENPAGAIKLTDADLAVATGGVSEIPIPISHNGHCTSSKLTPCCY
jgi:mersacidin/lichenicidin family type 2 lantibiotic